MGISGKARPAGRAFLFTLGYYTDMLIVLGGFLGSGRFVLADLLAEQSGFHHYPLLEKKKNLHFGKNHQLHERIMEPSTDPARMQLYREVSKDFPLISKMYKNVVIDDAFHREKPRSFFLEEARAYFNPVVFVWVESPDETVELRLQTGKHTGLVPDTAIALRKRKQMIKEFEPFPGSLVFFHRTSNKSAAETLLRFINQCVKRGLAD